MQKRTTFVSLTNKDTVKSNIKDIRDKILSARDDYKETIRKIQ